MQFVHDSIRLKTHGSDYICGHILLTFIIECYNYKYIGDLLCYQFWHNCFVKLLYSVHFYQHKLSVLYNY